MEFLKWKYQKIAFRHIFYFALQAMIKITGSLHSLNVNIVLAWFKRVEKLIILSVSLYDPNVISFNIKQWNLIVKGDLGEIDLRIQNFCYFHINAYTNINQRHKYLSALSYVICCQVTQFLISPDDFMNML